MAKGYAKVCENCGRMADFWTGRSRIYFRWGFGKSGSPVVTAGWCSDKCLYEYRSVNTNPTVGEVRELFEKNEASKAVTP